MSEVAEVVETPTPTEQILLPASSLETPNAEIMRQMIEQDSNALALNDGQKVRILMKHRMFVATQAQVEKAAAELNQTAIEIAAERKVELKDYTLDIDSLRFVRRPVAA